MTNRTDAKLFQVLVRQARKNRLVYLVLAECRLILPEAKAPQPGHDVHDDALLRSPRIMVLPERVSTGVRDNRTLHVSEARRLGDGAAIADVAATGLDELIAYFMRSVGHWRR
jgi:hypothetical protein